MTALFRNHPGAALGEGLCARGGNSGQRFLSDPEQALIPESSRGFGLGPCGFVNREA